MKPRLPQALDFAESTRTDRSYKAREKLLLKKVRRRVAAFMAEALTFQTPFRLEDAVEERGKRSTMERLESICDNELGATMPEQCFSAKFVDMDGTPIFFYFGDRIVGDPPPPTVITILPRI